MSLTDLVAATLNADQESRDSLSQAVFGAVPGSYLLREDEAKIEAAVDRTIAACRSLIVDELTRALA